MGRMQEVLRAYASLSNHNSDQDDADEEAWLDFVRKVRALAAEPKYDAIQIVVDAAH